MPQPLTYEQAIAAGGKPVPALTYEQAIAAGGKPVEDQPGALHRFASGVAKTLLPSTNAGDYIAPFTSLEPWKNLGLVPEAMYGAAKEQASKTKQAFQEGRYSEAAGHGLATVLPGIGPAAANAGESIGSGDIAGGLGQAVGLLAPVAVSEAVNATKGKISSLLEKSAAKDYTSVLQNTNKKLVPKAEQVGAALAERKPLAWSRGGLMKRAANEKATTGPLTATAYDNVPDVGAQRVQGILSDLEDLRQKHAMVKGTQVVSNPTLNSAIDGLKDTVTQLQDSLGNIPAKTLDDFRDKLFRGNVDATGNLRQTAPATAKTIEKSTAGGIKNILDTDYPSAAVINDNYHIWAKTYDFLENARRGEETSKAAIVTGSSKGFGAMVQRILPRPVRQLPNTVMGVFDSVPWNTVSGAAKQSVAEALARGDWEASMKIMLPSLAGTLGAKAAAESQ